MTVRAATTKAIITTTVAALLIAAPLASAMQSEAPPPPPPRDPEPLPPKVQDSDEQIEPEVRIRREDERTIEEYSTGGRVYMVRIVPDVGLPYYLVDTTGDGDFDTRHAHGEFDRVRPAHWKIIEW